MQVTPNENFETKVIVVTGANTGIGFITALDMAKRGSTVICACRDRERGQEAADKIIEETKNRKVFFEKLDLNDLSSVREFAKIFLEKYNRLDILINNAGIMMCPPGKTKDGFETQIGVNHLGHFLLTNLFLETIKKSAPSRIINVSSRAHTRGSIRWDDLNWEKEYSPTGAYSQSKLANVLFTIELAKRLKGTGVTAVSLHPGVVKTELARNLYGCLGCLAKTFWPCAGCCFLTPEEGAQTSIHCAVSADIPNFAGCYFSDSKVKQLSAKASNPDDAEKLWTMSVKLVKLE